MASDEGFDGGPPHFPGERPASGFDQSGCGVDSVRLLSAGGSSEGFLVVVEHGRFDHVVDNLGVLCVVFGFEVVG